MLKLNNSPNKFFKKISDDWWTIWGVSQFFHLWELKEHEENYTVHNFCGMFGWFCNQLNNFIGSKFSKYNNQSACELESTRDGQSSSLKSIIHFSQNFRDGVFRQFDYGNAELNEEHYGSKTVPALPLENIRVPVAMFVGTKDEISNTHDTREVYDYIKTSFFYQVYPNYDHFSW